VSVADFIWSGLLFTVPLVLFTFLGYLIFSHDGSSDIRKLEEDLIYRQIFESSDEWLLGAKPKQKRKNDDLAIGDDGTEYEPFEALLPKQKRKNEEAAS
jgi:hypothetical protein